MDRSRVAQHRQLTTGVTAILVAIALGACGQGGGGDATITRAQWQRIPWDLTQKQVVDRLGKSPSRQTSEKCSPSAEGRFCSKTIVYAFGDTTASFGFLRPENAGDGKLSVKTWTVSSKPNSITAGQYRAAIHPSTTVRQAEAKLGTAAQRFDERSACEVRGHSGCGSYVSIPARCLKYGWESGGGDHVFACFNLRTGTLLNDSFLTPSPSTTIQLPVQPGSTP